MLRRAEEVAEERAALYAERAAKHDAAEARCREEQRRVMAAEVELADAKAAHDTEMGRARSLHEALSAKLEAAAAELASSVRATLSLFPCTRLNPCLSASGQRSLRSQLR
jgi:hypothetical protein